MSMIRSLALAVVLAAGAQAMQAQQAAPSPRGDHGTHRLGPRHGEGDPFARLLERRQELNLTAQQVSRIEAIRARLQAQNQPLMEQLQAARRQAGLPDRSVESRGGERPRLTEEQRAAARQMRERMAPVAQQLRSNRRAAMREVHEVLTEAQREQLRQKHREHRGGRRGHRGHRG